eukprot:COSAG06_NODE_3515_length_5238_cov_29.717984_8_plen_112_part_00
MPFDQEESQDVEGRDVGAGGGTHHRGAEGALLLVSRAAGRLRTGELCACSSRAGSQLSRLTGSAAVWAMCVQVWLAIGGKAYDVTEFLCEHPGGEEVMMEVTGPCCSFDWR